MFEDISLTECLAIFCRIFGDILWNITFSHSPLSSYSITRSCIPGFIYSPPSTAGNPNIPSGDSNTIKSIIEEYKYHSRIINIRNQTNLNVNTFDFPHGTVEEIKLLKTYPKKATPDKIPPKIIKLSANIDSHFVNIINKDIDNNHFPENTITASVRPIFKKKERDKVENYRPVSISKLFL